MEIILEKQSKAYSQAVASGMYERAGGLRKKYDNVRLYWEDEITRHFITSALSDLLKKRRKEGKKLRILDMGCGSGDGYELLMGIRRKNAGLAELNPALIKEEDLEAYVGIDFNHDLLAQNKIRWQRQPWMDFRWGDLGQGLPVAAEEGFDIYFTSFGTLSHFTEEQTTKLLADITVHANDGAVVICDWLGRYSYEWQTLWDNDISREYWMDYLISYIYSPGERKTKELQTLKLRLLEQRELDRMLQAAGKKSGVTIQSLGIFDRSLLIGRHMDTCDYNPHLKALRQGMNSLFELNLRTDLKAMQLSYHPRQGFDEINSFLSNFIMCWNSLLDFANQSLTGKQPSQELCIPPELDPNFENILREELEHLEMVFPGAGELRATDLRANILEPQLANSLRNLEYRLQQGKGCGHGFLTVLRVIKEGG